MMTDFVEEFWHKHFNGVSLEKVVLELLARRRNEVELSARGIHLLSRRKGSLRKKKRKEKNDLVEEVGKENGLENVGSETEEFWKSKKEKKVRFGE